MTVSYSQGLKYCQTNSDDIEKGKGDRRIPESHVLLLNTLSPKQLSSSPSTLSSPPRQCQCKAGIDQQNH